jgi:hypothetical protein
VFLECGYRHGVAARLTLSRPLILALKKQLQAKVEVVVDGSLGVKAEATVRPFQCGFRILSNLFIHNNLAERMGFEFSE